MIRIGITQRALPLTTFGERRDGLDRRWPLFLQTCGIVACPLPNDPAVAVATAEALELEGLLLTGGEDLVALGGEQTGRDETERRLLDWALAARRPVIGVCRGMQMLVHSFGGRLHRVEQHVGTRHEIAFQGVARSVNSFHAWGATELPAPLVALARAGPVAEAVQLAGAPVLGLMWHPEREEPFDPLDLTLFRSVFGSTA